MKKTTWFIALVATLAVCSAANAIGIATPEIDAASSVSAIGLLLGALALVAERRRKRHSAE
jgi:hypothetical protein